MDAIYARQSVDKKDSISIESQIEFCNREITTGKYKVYTDKGYSGSNINRPAFEEMISEIKAGLVNRVIVYKLDRISRSLLDFAHIIECFDKYKVEFISQTERFDTSTSIGRAMLSIVMVFAQLERETIQQRVKDNYYQRGKNGFYLGGTAPYGFKKIETKFSGKKTFMFEEDEDNSSIVRLIFNMYSYGQKSLGYIARYLNSQNIKTNRGKNWTSCSVGRLIRNPVYVKSDVDVYLYLKNKGAAINNDINDFIGENGCYLYGERKSVSTSKFSDLTNSYVTIAPHKGLISPDQWLLCQYTADQNKCLKNSGRGNNSWLSGLMKCGFCGFAISVVKNPHYNYINCGGRKAGICSNRKRVIHLEEIEKIIEKELIGKVNTLTQEFNIRRNSNLRQINELKISLAKTDESIKKLVDSLLAFNEISSEYINNKITELDYRKNNLLNEISKLTVDNDEEESDKINLSDYFRNWNKFLLEQKKYIAHKLIERIIITDEKIEIIFRI